MSIDQEPVEGQESAIGQIREGDVLVSSTGKPFSTLGAAGSARQSRFSEATHSIVAVEGGYVLRPREGAALQVAAPGAAQPQAQKAERCFWVYVRPASNNLHVNQRVATPGVNGEQLFLLRGRKYALLERFVDAMRHTLHPVSRYTPGSDRKEVLWQQDEQFDIQEECDPALYYEWARRTNKGEDEYAEVLRA